MHWWFLFLFRFIFEYNISFVLFCWINHTFKCNESYNKEREKKKQSHKHTFFFEWRNDFTNKREEEKKMEKIWTEINRWMWCCCELLISICDRVILMIILIQQLIACKTYLFFSVIVAVVACCEWCYAGRNEKKNHHHISSLTLIEVEMLLCTAAFWIASYARTHTHTPTSATKFMLCIRQVYFSVHFASPILSSIFFCSFHRTVPFVFRDLLSQFTCLSKQF